MLKLLGECEAKPATGWSETNVLLGIHVCTPLFIGASPPCSQTGDGKDELITELNDKTTDKMPDALGLLNSDATPRE